jgi:hypothetical protein
MRYYFGPQGTAEHTALGERVLAAGDAASFSIAASALPIRSETSAMQAQPEIVLERVNSRGEVTEEQKLVPPIYYRHVPGAGFGQIEVFDEATLISERGGKLAWGSGETLSLGDLLGYVNGSPVLAGQGDNAKMYNERGEVVGYTLGTRLGSDDWKNPDPRVSGGKNENNNK